MNLHRYARAGAPPGPGRQRGATLVLVATFLMALLACMMLAVEVGRLYTAQSSLQRTADMAALDAARVIGGCSSGAPPADFDTATQTAIANAITRNNLDEDEITSAYDLGLLENTTPRLTFNAGAGAGEPDSVRVVLNRPPPVGLTSFFAGQGQQMQATATAVSRPVAQISVGSKLINVGGTSGLNSLLSALLGGSVNLSVASYEALIGANVTIADLVNASAGIATPEELLNTNLTLPAALQLLADAVDETVAGSGGLAASTLDTLAGVADPSRTVLPGDVLIVEEGLENAVGQIPVNVADLLTALAQAANEGSPISLPANVNLGALGSASATINILEAPTIALGRAGQDALGNYRTVANTSQAAIQLRLTVLGFPGSGVINLPLYVKAASAQARLEDLLCANPLQGRSQHQVSVGTGTSIAQIGIGEFDDIDSLNPQPTGEDVTVVSLNLVLGLLEVRIRNMAPIDVGSGAGSQTLDFTGPFPPQPDSEPQTQTVGSDLSESLNNALGTLASALDSNSVYVHSDIPLLGTLIGGLLNGVVSSVSGLVNLVVNLLQPVLDLVGDALLIPLFNLLGLDVGAADVTVQAVLVDEPRIYRRDDD